MSKAVDKKVHEIMRPQQENWPASHTQYVPPLSKQDLEGHGKI